MYKCNSRIKLNFLDCEKMTQLIIFFEFISTNLKLINFDF